MQVRTVWDSDAHAVQVAGECVLVSGSFGMPRLAAMIAANPQLIFAPYLKSVQNPVSDDPSGTRYPAKWYAHMKDGTRAKQTGSFVNWVMETGFYSETHQTATVTGPISGTPITASCWAMFHILDSAQNVVQTNAAPAQLGSHPFRSLWFDSADTFSADNVPGFWSGSNPGWNPHTLAPYQKQEFRDMAAYTGDAARNLTTLGTLNPERLWVTGNGLRVSSFAGHWDMAMCEGWMYNNGTPKYTDQASWEALIQRVLDSQLVFGTVAETLDWGATSGPNSTAAGRTQQRRFTAASDMISNRGLKTFEWVSAGKSERPDLETAHDPSLYALDLGAPLSSPALATGHRVTVGTANGQASATGLSARLYDGGAALINPTGVNINYKADRTYTLVPSLEGTASPSYSAGGTVSVPFRSGVFLTHAGGSGGAAPVNVYLPSVLGTPREGQLMRVELGSYTSSPAAAITEAWQQAGTPSGAGTAIAGATSHTYSIPFGTGGTATVYAADAFGDTVSNGWGTAAPGGSWTIEQGGTADYAKASGVGTFSHGGANTAKFISLNVGLADLDTVVSLKYTNTPTGGNMQGSLCLRYADTSNYLRLNTLLAASGGHLTANPDKVVTGTATSLGTAKDLGSYSAGATVKLRMRLEGANLKAKAWMGTASEPGSWDWDVTDSSISAAGKLAIRSYRGTGNTNTSPQTKADDLTASSLVGTVTGLAGKFLRTAELATNTAGSQAENSAYSAVIATGAMTDPIWTTLPSASGTPAEGSDLTANPGTLTGTPTPTVTYQWETSADASPGSASNISGETAAVYSVASGTSGAFVRCNVQASNAGATVHQWTGWLGPITASSTAPSPTVAPSISGTTTAGDPLTLALGAWAGTPPPSFTQQWQRSTDSGATYSDITGETSLTYLLQTGDAGCYIRAGVTATNSSGVTVAYTAPVGVIVLPGGFPNLSISVTLE